MNIVQNIDNFMQKIYNNQNHRYTSWEICFKSFGNEDLDDETKALHLAGYLCSWGMYRGSSMLLSEYNYMIFKDLVPILNEYLDLRKDFLEESDYDRFLEVVNKITTFLDERDIASTDTLTTKIILGIYGCFPALDNYFITGYRKVGYSFSEKVLIDIQKFSIFYNTLKSFYFANETIFDTKRWEIRANRGIDYPPIKLIDMCFWEYGNMLKELEKIKKRLQNES